MTVTIKHTIVLLLQTAMILQGSNGLWSSGPGQRYSQPQQECCKRDNYIGLVPPTPPSYDRYRYEGFQNYPRIYQESYHNKHNQYSNHNRRYLPSKHSSYSKDYYRKGQSHISSHIQRRTGFGFVDDNYIKRAYTKPENRFNFRNSQVNYRQYYEKDYVQNDREIQNDKYSPGILLSSVADRLSTIIVTDPDGIKHRIDSYSLKELELPESNKPYFLSGYNDPIKGAIDTPKTSSDFPDELKLPLPTYPFNRNGYIYPKHKTAVIERHYNGSFSANLQKEHMQNNGYVGSSRIRFPSDVNDFHPSPPFHKYSEPDPLYHPNGSPLQTHAPQFVTASPTTTTAFPTPRKQPSYPDSINAQLPPTDNKEDTHVPYVTDQVYDTKSTSATQATEATQKQLSLTQIAPTKPSPLSTPEHDIISSTQQSIREDKKIWDFLPTVQEVSSSPVPQVLNNNNGSSSPYKFSTESPTHTIISTETPKSKILPSVSNLDNNPIDSFPTIPTKPDLFETVKNNYELQQEPTTETQLFGKQNINTTVMQTTTASVEPEIQTYTQSTASIFVPGTSALEDIDNVTHLEDFYFSSISNVTLHEETATTMMPDGTHTY